MHNYSYMGQHRKGKKREKKHRRKEGNVREERGKE
jgi:hypothetical protein